MVFLHKGTKEACKIEPMASTIALLVEVSLVSFDWLLTTASENLRKFQLYINFSKI